MDRDDKLFFLLNIILWILIYSISYYHATHIPEEKTQIGSSLSGGTASAAYEEPDDTAIDTEQITSTDVDYSTVSDSEASSVIRAALAGSYMSKSGYSFYFGDNGYYSGFFDSQNKEMEGGSYELYEIEDNVNLRIISSDNQRMVEYTLLMNGPNGFTLIYEPTGFNIKLEKIDE